MVPLSQSISTLTTLYKSVESPLSVSSQLETCTCEGGFCNGAEDGSGGGKIRILSLMLFMSFAVH